MNRLQRWKTPSLILLCVLLCTLASGCGERTRVVGIKHSDPIRLGPDVEGHIWVKGADGKDVLSTNKVKLPELWYAVEPPDDAPPPKKGP